jgi:hypothetical protein
MVTTPPEPPEGTVALSSAPAPGTPRTGRRGAPLPVAAGVAALWAAIVSYAPLAALCVAGAWGSGLGLGGPFRLAAAGWLLAHGVPVDLPADRITLMPLALTVFVVWRLVRAGVHTSRAIGGHRSASPARALAAGAAVGLAYGVVGMAVAAGFRSDELGLPVWRSGATLALLAGVLAIAGALAHGRAGPRLARAVPVVLRDAVRAGLAAAALVVAAGAGLAGVALAIHGAAAAEMLGSYRVGVLGQAGVTALCLAFLPNAAVWGAAYLLGPGFSIGVGTAVSPGEVLLGSVPGLPVLAGLPSQPLTGPGPLLLGAPLLAGVAAGVLLARYRQRRGWPGLLGAAVLAGPVAGAAVQGACLASAGSLGSGRLAEIGPSDWRIALLATVVVSLGALIGAALSAPIMNRGS